MLRPARKAARRLLLRGPILDRWVRHRSRQLDRAYVSQLTRTAASPAIAAPTLSTGRGALRRMFYISDCMWELNDLVPELRKITEVFVLDLRPKLRLQTNSQPLPDRVLSCLNELAAQTGPEPDLIFFYARPELLSEEIFECLRRRWHCPLLGMNLDDKMEFFPYGILASGDDDYQHWARHFDLNLTNTLAATDWYGQRNLPSLYCPPGLRATTDPLPTSMDYQYELSFLGSVKPERRVIIDQLAAAKLPIQLFGNGWPNSRWVDDANTVFRSTQINLGIGFASPSLALTTVKNRDFECPGAGACYLTTYNWELPIHYELGKEILCYRSVEELIEMYLYYRKRPSDCLRIAQAAWRRCSSEHTWEKRFRKVFQHLGFKLQ